MPIKIAGFYKLLYRMCTHADTKNTDARTYKERQIFKKADIEKSMLFRFLMDIIYFV